MSSDRFERIGAPSIWVNPAPKPKVISHRLPRDSSNPGSPPNTQHGSPPPQPMAHSLNATPPPGVEKTWTQHHHPHTPPRNQIHIAESTGGFPLSAGPILSLRDSHPTPSPDSAVPRTLGVGGVRIFPSRNQRPSCAPVECALQAGLRTHARTLGCV